MYPPKHHSEHDLEKIYLAVESFPLATVISARHDDVHVSYIPLVLDRTRGDYGTLIGHIDKSNPQAQLLDEQKVTVIFHGPNCYISPTVYQSSQLPTWNYLNVEITGKVKTIGSNAALKESLISMAEFLEPENNPYVLSTDDKRMEALLNYILGFEIEITEVIGRFKLSQDKSKIDLERATQHLITKNKIGHDNLINTILRK